MQKGTKGCDIILLTQNNITSSKGLPRGISFSSKNMENLPLLTQF